jgi:hypothetical protein
MASKRIHSTAGSTITEQLDQTHCRAFLGGLCMAIDQYDQHRGAGTM